MEKTHQQLLHKILGNFDGMQKIDSFDVLHKIEVLLFYAKTPINLKNLDDILSSNINPEEIDPFQLSILPNGNFCEFIAANNWLHIYREYKKGFSRLNPSPSYYFRTKYAPLELLKLTKKNVIESVANTPIESRVMAFLKKNKASKKDMISNKMLLIEVS